MEYFYPSSKTLNKLKNQQTFKKVINNHKSN